MRSIFIAAFLITATNAYALRTPETNAQLPLAKLKCDPEVFAVYGIAREPGRTIINGQVYRSVFVVDMDGTATLLVKTQAEQPEVFFCTAELM